MGKDAREQDRHSGRADRLVTGAVRRQSAEELAKKLSNPAASLISVPLQFNHDEEIGAADGRRSNINVQRVVPISTSRDWNLISHTIAPLIDQKDIAGSSGSQSGIGDILQSAFFSPKAPTARGLIGDHLRAEHRTDR